MRLAWHQMNSDPSCTMQVDLEVLRRSGTETEKKHAARIVPVVKQQHLLLVTLLLMNAAAMEVQTCRDEALTLCTFAVAATHAGCSTGTQAQRIVRAFVMHKCTMTG